MTMMRSVLMLVSVVFALALSEVPPSELPMTGARTDNETAADSVALDNAYVQVLQNASARGSAHSDIYGTRIIVALTTVSLHSSRGALQLERGQVAPFVAHESYESPTGEYFEVAIKTNHPPLTSPDEWIEPQNNTIVYEDEQLRIFEERLPPGAERPLHSHAQRIVVRLNEVQLTDPRFPRSSKPGAGLQVPNTVRFAEPVVHVVKNLSEAPLFNVVIEFKVGH